MKQHPNFALVVAALTTLSVASAVGQTPQEQRLGDFNYWIAVSFVEDGQRNCYIASAPTKEKGNYTKRGPAYVQITRRHHSDIEVVSFQAGYRFKEESEVAVQIDGTSYKLFTDAETAWAYNEEGDRQLIESMRQGTRMLVIGTSWRGTKTTDTYSLIGFTKAHKKILDACN
ncbi:uncharacterized protein METZ01_LOCUS449091 [marine metagenome]|uniref:Uncharacterized protein n=1 Tax=marine metagenome TaxID=408172 RepID=A0A382ZL14_9ZZZZ